MHKHNTKKIKQQLKNIEREKFFEKRLEEEKKRGEMFELSYVLIKFKVLVEDLKKVELNIRSVDKAGYSEEKKLLSIIFPATQLKNVELLKSKMLERNLGVLEEYHED